MKKITFLILIFAFEKAQAQQKPNWQFIFEVNGTFASSTQSNAVSNNYKLLDSATSLFRKYNYESNYGIKSKLKIGASGGIKFNYPVAKNLTINIGLLLSHYSAEKTNDFTSKFIDSPTVTLQRSANGWIDPATNQQVLYFQTLYNPGYSVLIGGLSQVIFYTTSSNKKYFTDKLNFTAFDIPIGTEYTFTRSKLSVSAEISPVFLISSSVAANYPIDREVQFVTNPDYKVNSLLWRIGAGINYPLDNNLKIGLNFKRTINSVLVVSEPLRLNSLGLQVHFSLPKK